MSEEQIVNNWERVAIVLQLIYSLSGVLWFVCSGAMLSSVFDMMTSFRKRFVLIFINCF